MNIYQQMCQSATEIQERWEDKIDNRVCFVNDKGKIGNPFTLNSPEGISPRLREQGYTKDQFIWLPRIEDLIEMVADKKGFTTWYQMVLCCLWADHQELGVGDIKEVCLRFVMHTLYNKTWSGTTWEKINE